RAGPTSRNRARISGAPLRAPASSIGFGGWIRPGGRPCCWHDDRGRRYPSAMNRSALLDAIVVGSGPNGLAAAITLARAGRSVRLIESEATVGGGCRSGELTLPGFVHDICSAVHPLGRSSPFFAQLPLGHYGLNWIEPPVQIAHPLDDGAVLLLRDL